MAADLMGYSDSGELNLIRFASSAGVKGTSWITRNLAAGAFCLPLWWLVDASALHALDPHRAPTQYTRAVWTEAQGLPQDYIHAITQTSDGYLWVGTDEGLTRFDGYDFVTFNKDSGTLPSNTVTVLTPGTDGALWIGTSAGLTRYRNNRFTTFTTKDGLPDNEVVSLCQDHAGSLWIATASRYLSRFENEKFSTYPAERIEPLKSVRWIYEDRHQRLFVAGLEGVLERRGEDFAPVLGPREMGEQTVATLIEDASGSLWLGGGAGVLRRTPDGKVKLFDTRDGLPNRRVRDVWADRNGNLWVGTSGGLSRLEGDRFVTKPFDTSHDLDVRCFFEDREGNLWVGTNNGLHRFRDDRFVVYGRTEGLPSDQPIVVHQDRRGTIWVGYHNTGLVEFRGSDYRVYTTRDGLPSDELFSIHDCGNGDLLLATRMGLSRMHDGKFTTYVLPERLERRQIFDAIEDKRGRIWVAAPGGVFLLEGREFRNVVPAIGARQINSADMLVEGPDGTIWAGTLGVGFWRIKDGEVRRFSTADGLGSDMIRSLSLDPDGTLWVGTLEGGLNAYRNGTFVRYAAKDGLLSDNVSHIEDDGAGSLWLSTTRGISRVSKQQLRDFAEGRISRLTPVNYGIDDGLRSAECAPGYPFGGGGTRTRDGRLWFPTTSGLAMLDPRQTTPQTPPTPLAHVQALMVDGREIGVESEAKIKPGAEQIQLRYDAIHLRAPERITYDCRLEGLNRNWTATGSRRVMGYGTLRSGHYRFVVRASVPGLPSSEAAFDFEVLPHFYEKGWFRSLSVAAFLALIYALYQLRLRQVRGRFSLVLEERSRMAREIHDTLAQGLVGISSQLDALAMKMDGDAKPQSSRWELTQRLEVAQKMARHTLAEARRALMDLRSPDFASRDLSAALERAARNWTAGSATSLQISATGTSCELPAEIEHNVLRIAQEAVTNALKHAAAKSVWIDIRQNSHSLQLTIRDDGCGFEPSQAFVAGAGHFGLLGMHERAQRLGGEFNLWSEPGAGTEMKLTVPLPSDEIRKGIFHRLRKFMLLPMQWGRS